MEPYARPPVVDNLLSLIHSYRTASERLSPLDQVANYFGSLEHWVKSITESADAESRDFFIRYLGILRRYLFVFLVCRRKLDAINSLLEFSISSGNSIGIAHGTRALLEHLAVKAAIARSLSKSLDRVKGLTDRNMIDAVVTDSERFLHRCYFGKSNKLETERTNQALHINDCLKILAEWNDRVLVDYDYLCEFVHPNAGSNELVSSGVKIESIFSIAHNLTSEATIRMATIALKAFEVSKDIETVALAGLSVGVRYVRRLRFDKTKVTNVFSIKTISPIGDGKTKDTAIKFPGARDGVEAIELFYRYTKKRKMTVFDRRLLEMRYPVAIDVYDTDRGLLYHQVDHSDESQWAYFGVDIQLVSLFGYDFKDFDPSNSVRR